MLLKDVVFGYYVNELKETTRGIFYEQWRTEKLMQVRGSLIQSAGVIGGVRAL